MVNFFTDVISKDSRLDGKERIADLALLEPITRTMVQSIVGAANKGGIQVMVFETFRSSERQIDLFNKGASTLKTVGVHHYGLACDIVRNINGEPSWKSDFGFLGKLAHSFSLIWGGDWGNPGTKRSFVDSDHVQRITLKRQTQLFAGTWYPNESYDPYQDD